MMSSKVVDAPERKRFELVTGGETAFIDYDLDGDLFTLEHTIVPEALSGQGIGSQLANASLVAIRASNRRARIKCDFLRRWLTKHPEFDDIIEQ